MSFVICSYDPINANPNGNDDYFMLDTGTGSQYLHHFWSQDINHPDIKIWHSYDQCYFDAKGMWARYGGYNWAIDLYIYQVNVGGQPFNRTQLTTSITQFTSKWVATDPSASPASVAPPAVQPTTTQGVYSTPEETLKAYRSGKYVNWKKIAERNNSNQ